MKTSTSLSSPRTAEMRSTVTIPGLDSNEFRDLNTSEILKLAMELVEDLVVDEEEDGDDSNPILATNVDSEQQQQQQASSYPNPLLSKHNRNRCPSPFRAITKNSGST